MQPDEDFLVSFRDTYVFSCAISLFIKSRFSEVHGRVCYHNRFSGLLVGSQKTAEAVAARSAVVNIQLQNARNSIFNAPFWAFDGFLVNLMYRGLAEWLGDRTSVPIVAAKICLDQFGYNPLFAMPYGIWGYAWKNSGYSFAKLRPLLTWQYYRKHALPVVIAAWAVWLPLRAGFYAVPLALQFPLFALALAFWVLMMTYMTNRFAGKIEADAELPISVVGDVEELKS